MKPKARVFFYGSYINREVLKEVDFAPDDIQVGRLHGFDIQIRPLANLVRSGEHAVYGIVASATHDELDRLYAHARNVLGGVYTPEAVLVETEEGAFLSALCYIASRLEPKPATDAYLDRIIGPARELGFPAWYLNRLESFRP